MLTKLRLWDQQYDLYSLSSACVVYAHIETRSQFDKVARRHEFWSKGCMWTVSVYDPVAFYCDPTLPAATYTVSLPELKHIAYH